MIKTTMPKHTIKPPIKTILTLVAIATTDAAALTMLAQAQHTQPHEPNPRSAKNDTVPSPSHHYTSTSPGNYSFGHLAYAMSNG